MVASYDKNTEYSAHDPDGVCLVWNTRFKKTTPEHVFHCQSPVTVATFARFHPNLIIGGTYRYLLVHRITLSLSDGSAGYPRTRFRVLESVTIEKYGFFIFWYYLMIVNRDCIVLKNNWISIFSGQVVVWDNRVQKKTPVQRSPLSATAHTHPVYCMKVVGTQNAHNLISISTDGRLCSWSLDMLSQPQETLELQQQKQSRVSSMR